MTDTMTIDEERWAEVQKRGLESGAHADVTEGMCAMEAVAYIAREPFSDYPQCVSPCIAAFMCSWNDALPDSERSILLPLLPKVVGTRNDALEERRGLMAVDWYIRTHLPAWLDLAGLKEQAALVRSLPEITATSQMPSLRAPLEAIRRDASAAWSAAESAAWSAAESAAWSAAESAAWSAARSAARSAAESVFADTKAKLQASAIELVERMCALTAPEEKAAA